MIKQVFESIGGLESDDYGKYFN